MPTRDGYSEGVPCWVDLATPDMEAAMAFYGPLFGWEIDTGEHDPAYAMALRKGMPAAGLGKLPAAGAETVWSTYFAVDDAHATAKRIEQAGGSLTMAPAEVDDMGTLAFAQDPTGAEFGIWQAGAHFGAAIVNEHGSINWNELVTDDPARAIAFYRRVFGHGSKTATTPSGREYTMLEVASREIAGIIEPKRPGLTAHWIVYFAVDDAETAAETARISGGTVSYGPIEQPDVGRFIGMKDPLGAAFTVIELMTEID